MRGKITETLRSGVADFSCHVIWHDEQGLDHSLVLILHYLQKHHCCLLSCCNLGTQISKRNNSRSLV
jgi:hypothetical protein